jgi:hypothetical protein
VRASFSSSVGLLSGECRNLNISQLRPVTGIASFTFNTAHNQVKTQEGKEYQENSSQKELRKTHVITVSRRLLYPKHADDNITKSFSYAGSNTF